jgi:hypothetical protein
MAERLQRLAKKETHAKKMNAKYDGWHARADCTGIVPKKGEEGKKTDAGKVGGKKEENLHPFLETGVMRLLVVRRCMELCIKDACL